MLRRRSRGTLAVLRYAEVPERTRLAEHLDALTDRMTPLHAGDAQAVLDGRLAPPARGVVIVFDHAGREAVDRVLPLVAARGLPALVGVVTGHLGGTAPFWWDEAAQLVAGGASASALDGMAGDPLAVLLALPEPRRAAAMEELRAAGVAARGRAHLDAADLRTLVGGGITVVPQTVHHPPLTRCDEATVLAEIAGARDALAAITGPAPAWLAHPFGLVDERVAALAARAGVRVGIGGEPGLMRPPVESALATPSVAVGAGWPAEGLERVLLHLAAPARLRG